MSPQDSAVPKSRIPGIGLAILAGLALAGCMHQPLPYSPNYSRITLADDVAVRGGAVHKGYDVPPPRAARVARRSRTVIVPDACITPDVAAQPVYLPSGCANNLNLQIMVERPGDLFRGRNPGPAEAAPTVRAAQRYLYGGTEWERRFGRLAREDEQQPPAAPPQGARSGSR